MDGRVRSCSCRLDVSDYQPQSEEEDPSGMHSFDGLFERRILRRPNEGQTQDQQWLVFCSNG